MPKFFLSDVKIDGFAVSNTTAGDTAKICFRALLTSDEHLFHKLLQGTESVLSYHLEKQKIELNFNDVTRLLLVVHQDNSAELHLNDIAMSANMLAKRDFAKGDIVFRNDISDIRQMQFLDVSLEPHDKVLCCFKVGWKFGLFFDFGRRHCDLDRELMERDIARLYRLLAYEEVYAAIADPALMTKLATAGWFPFQEIVTDGFEQIIAAYRDDFDIDGREQTLLTSFDERRLIRIADRWWRHSTLSARRDILEPALAAFQRGDSVSCIKNLLTEIEGIVHDAYAVETGQTARGQALLEYAIERGIRKAGDGSTLFFPREFLDYLKNRTFAHFDRMASVEAPLSRHSASHGAAPASAYTRVRSLQAILTVDQISFFL
jgi:hypothetical protein